MAEHEPIISSDESASSDSEEDPDVTAAVKDDGDLVQVSRPFRLTVEPLVGAVLFAQSFTGRLKR